MYGLHFFTNYFSLQIKEFKELKLKNDKDIELLRMERKAFEEVVDSLRYECETLRSSLNTEFVAKDQLRGQINFLIKKINELEENNNNNNKDDNNNSILD